MDKPDMDTPSDAAASDTAIVSASQLAEGEGAESSELEYGLIIAFNAFSRWMQHCMDASGQAGMSPLEILVLHHVNHRNRAKRLSDICFSLNIEDSHLVNYALKKLAKHGLLENEKQGKEVFYSTSEAGAALCLKYRDVRRQCLLPGLIPNQEGTPEGLTNAQELRYVARLMRRLSGHYDQASRAAASM